MLFRSPTGGSTQNGTDYSKQISDLQDQINQLLAQQQSDRQGQYDSAVAFLKDTLTMYGMGDLAGQVESLVTQWGNNQSVIANQLRQTDSYRSRFKGLLALQGKGITDVANEAQYIKLESDYRQVFRDAGLQNFLGTAGSKAEQDSIAKLAGDYSVSVNEVQNRIADAQRVAQNANPEVVNALQQYYGVTSADLVAYSLDPTRTTARINQQANAAVIGGLASTSGLNIGRSVAEQYAALAGNDDISAESVNQRLASARQTRDATARLANIEGSSLSDEETLMAETDLNKDAQSKIRGLQSRERARFGGTSGFNQGSLNDLTNS